MQPGVLIPLDEPLRECTAGVVRWCAEALSELAGFNHAQGANCKHILQVRAEQELLGQLPSTASML